MRRIRVDIEETDGFAAKVNDGGLRADKSEQTQHNDLMLTASTVKRPLRLDSEMEYVFFIESDAHDVKISSNTSWRITNN